MPARIIQTNADAFAPVKIDPVTLDIVENALRNARIEMDATLVRTAMSPGIREQGDAFPLIANPDGKMIVGQFGSFIDGFMRNFDGTIEEGDMILLSDPYSCEGAVSHSTTGWCCCRSIAPGDWSHGPRCSATNPISAARSPGPCRSTPAPFSRKACASRQ